MSNHKMKIAITGGRGFVGKYLLDLLSVRYGCVVLGRGKQEDLEVNGQKIPYIQTNYGKEQLLHQLEDVQAVVHMASKRYEPNEKIFDYFTSINVADNLFYTCAALGITNVVFLSSRAVYGVNPKIPWQEGIETTPVTFYGISKITVEKMAEYYNNRYDLKIKSLRLAQIVGLEEREGYMVSTFLNQAINKKRLEIWGEGKGSREYIYVKDVVRAVEKSLENDKIRGIFNIGSNMSTSHRELADIINRIFNNAGNLDLLENKKADETNYLMDSNKAASVLGWAPKWTLGEALIDMQKKLANEQQTEVS